MSGRGRTTGLVRAGLVLVALVVGVPGVLIAAAWSATPGVGDLERRVDRQLPAGQARPAPLSAISPIVVDSLIATEDERFRSNSGIDVIGLMRAIPYDVTHLSLRQGASTLTEQLAKNLWLHGSDQSVWPKLEDMALALKLDRRWSKDSILAAYLNTAYFGQGAYGIAAASERYFGIAPGALDDTQATLLVGLVQAPSSYDPYSHPAVARMRQAAVLRSLVRVGRLSASRAERLLAQPVRLANGAIVPGLGGVDLASGPALDGTSFALALLAAVAAAVILMLRGAVRDGRPFVSRLAALLALGLLGVSIVVAVRSLRVI